MCFSSAAKSEGEKPHLLGKQGESLLWGFLSSLEWGNPSFLLASAPLPQLLELRNWNCGIAVMEERQVKLPWGEGEQLLTEHGGGGVK